MTTTATDTPPLPSDEPLGGLAGQHRRSFATTRVILALMLREMSASYGNSPGGYIWAILEPVGMIFVLSFGFALMMRHPSLGNSFILFYASGYLPFSQYKNIESTVNKSINYSRSLLYYPAVTWLDAIIARFLLNTLTATLNMILIFWGILMITGVSPNFDFTPMVLAMVLASLLGLGVGTLNCLLFGLFPLWASAFKIITRPLVLASAVLYVIEDLPSRAGYFLTWNPLTHITGLMRTGVFSSYHPEYISIPYVLGLALVTLALGLLFMRKYASDVINKS